MGVQVGPISQGAIKGLSADPSPYIGLKKIIIV